MAFSRAELLSAPMAIVAFGCVVLFGSIAFMLVLVILSIAGVQVDFVGEPHIHDAAALAVAALS